MNNALQNFIDIWIDLEASYKAKGGNVSRVEYLKMITMFDETTGKHKLSILLTKVNSFIQTNQVPSDLVQDVTKIIEMLKDLSTYLDVNGLPKEIENLTIFMLSQVNYREPEFTKEGLFNLVVASPKLPTEVTYEEMFRHHQAFSEVIVSNTPDQLTYSHFIGVPTDDMILVLLHSEVAMFYASRKRFRKQIQRDALACISIYLSFLNTNKILTVVDKSLITIVDEDTVSLFGHVFKARVFMNGDKQVGTFSAKGAEVCWIL